MIALLAESRNVFKDDHFGAGDLYIIAHVTKRLSGLRVALTNAPIIGRPLAIQRTLGTAIATTNQDVHLGDRHSVSRDVVNCRFEDEHPRVAEEDHPRVALADETTSSLRIIYRKRVNQTDVVYAKPLQVLLDLLHEDYNPIRAREDGTDSDGLPQMDGACLNDAHSELLSCNIHGEARALERLQCGCDATRGPPS